MFTELGFIECTFLKLVIAERKWLKAPSCTASNWSLQTRCTDFYRSLSLGAFCESNLLLMPLGEKAGIYRCLKKEVNHIKWLSWNKSRKWESDNIKHLLAFQLNQGGPQPQLMTSTLLYLHLTNRKEVGRVAFVFSKYSFFIPWVFRNLIIKISHCTHNL